MKGISRTEVFFFAVLFAFLATVSSQAKEESSSKSFGITGGVTALSSLHELSHVDHRASIVFGFIPKYSISRSVTLSSALAFTKDLEGDQEFTIEDPEVSLGYQKKLNPYLVFGSDLGVAIAVNPDSIRNDSLIFATSLSPALTLDFSRFGASGLSLTNAMAFTKAFHEFRTKASGPSNIEYALSEALVLSYRFLEKFSVSATGAYAFGWTYAGVLNQSFKVKESLGYQITDVLAAAIGHSNSGRSFLENGVDSNISIFNGESSTVYGSLQITI